MEELSGSIVCDLKINKANNSIILKTNKDIFKIYLVNTPDYLFHMNNSGDIVGSTITSVDVIHENYGYCLTSCPPHYLNLVRLCIWHSNGKLELVYSYKEGNQYIQMVIYKIGEEYLASVEDEANLIGLVGDR